MASILITSWQIDEETVETLTDFIFLGSRITEDCDCSQEIKRHLLPGKKAMTNPDSILKSRDTNFTDKDLCSQSYGFSSCRVWMWVLDHKEGWTPKNWSFWTMVLEKSLEGPLDWKEIKSVNPKWNQSWIFIGKTETEAAILQLPDVKNWLTGNVPGADKGWRQEEKGTTAFEMVGWHHRLDGRVWASPRNWW